MVHRGHSDVVVAYDTDVLRHPHPPCRQPGDDTDGHRVVKDHHCRDGRGQDRIGGLDPSLPGRDVLAQVDNLDTQAVGGLPEGIATTHIGPRERRATGVADASVLQ